MTYLMGEGLQARPCTAKPFSRTAGSGLEALTHRLAFLLGLGLMLGWFNSINAQSYDAAIGLRLGTDFGATAQVRLPQIHKNFVLEGIVQQSLTKDQGYLTVLGKQHQNILSRRLNLFYGAGAHIGWSDEPRNEGEPARNPFGIDGIIGAEITFAKVNISYDFKPAINIRGGDGILDMHTGISVRCVIAKRNDIWDKKKERKNRRERKRRQRERADKKWFQFWKKG